MDGAPLWSLDHCSDRQYFHKFTDVVRILAEWFEPYGGLRGKDVLEFGCGEGTVALGIALQHEPRRVVGAEILDVHENCLPYARKNLGLDALPDNLSLVRIEPGEDIARLGTFDRIYSWSVFEHVHPDLLLRAFQSLKAALAPGGVVFLQISPLYFSRDGSHLAPWIPVPWGHLTMDSDAYFQQLMSAPDTPPDLRNAWSVYIPIDAPRQEERKILWETYRTLNKATAPQLEQLARQAGLTIVRDFRTTADGAIPPELAKDFDENILLTEQIVWLLQHS
jgi:SAM-dependent methyltransferase